MQPYSPLCGELHRSGLNLCFRPGHAGGYASFACPGGPPVRGARAPPGRVCPACGARRLRVAAATAGACVARRRRFGDAAAGRPPPRLPLGAGGGGGNSDRAGGAGGGAGDAQRGRPHRRTPARAARLTGTSRRAQCGGAVPDASPPPPCGHLVAYMSCGHAVGHPLRVPGRGTGDPHPCRRRPW